MQCLLAYQQPQNAPEAGNLAKQQASQMPATTCMVTMHPEARRCTTWETLIISLTFRVHRQHDVCRKALAAVYLGHYFQRNLKRDEVAAWRAPIARPAVRAAHEVLILNVDEVLRAPNGCDVGRVDALVYRLHRVRHC